MNDVDGSPSAPISGGTVWLAGLTAAKNQINAIAWPAGQRQVVNRAGCYRAR